MPCVCAFVSSYLSHSFVVSLSYRGYKGEHVWCTYDDETNNDKHDDVDDKSDNDNDSGDTTINNDINDNNKNMVMLTNNNNSNDNIDKNDYGKN